MTCSKMRLPALLSRLLRRAGILPAPPPTPLAGTDTLWLYDNLAFPSSTSPSGWSAEFIAAYFTAYSGQDLSRAVADIAEKLGLGEGDAAEATIAERVQPFLALVVEGRTAEVEFGGNGEKGGNGAGTVTLGPSNGGGVSINQVELPGGGWRDAQEVVSRAVLPAGMAHGVGGTIAELRTRFAGAEGWAVVSDIDDTIKVSHVRDRISLLRHTFALPPTAVDAMPELYASLNTTLKPAWFYLSASPYNLFPMLRSFIATHFPHGQLLLREMSWQELESFVVSLTVGTQAYKEAELERIMAHLPQRRWVLIGDSTQKDPEAYAAAYKKNPEKVRKIWIRAVKGVDEKVEKALNSEERWEEAFKGVPRGVWSVFEDPAQLEREAGELVAEVEAEGKK
ncbi:hypothetical protein EDC01DRAFT_446003 [Geopyxis carbonaria]|nr:hypothetical protein EDC01DRAFT_446003 [Geopyxis carbonaria]